MRAALTFPAVVVMALLVTQPMASALTIQTARDPADSANLSDPGSSPHNFQGQPLEDNGSTMHIGGATLHFGVSNGPGASYGGGANNWFLDSPASRTVPSQAR